MEEQGSKAVSTFDNIFTNNRIQMLKILLPWLAPGQQGGFAVYIKLLELQYAMTFLHRHPAERLFGNGRQLSAASLFISSERFTFPIYFMRKFRYCHPSSGRRCCPPLSRP